MSATGDTITYLGATYSRHVFMELIPKAQEIGINELCSYCGELPDRCKCGRHSNVCLPCGRKLEFCTCGKHTP